MGHVDMRALNSANDLSDTAQCLDRLFAAISSQAAGPSNVRPLPPRTAKLIDAGIPKMGQKLVEEAAEAAIAAVQGDRENVILESADLLYHFVVMLRALDIPLEAVWSEMARREKMLGLAEKLPKTPIAS